MMMVLPGKVKCGGGCSCGGQASCCGVGLNITAMHAHSPHPLTMNDSYGFVCIRVRRSYLNMCSSNCCVCVFRTQYSMYGQNKTFRMIHVLPNTTHSNRRAYISSESNIAHNGRMIGSIFATQMFDGHDGAGRRTTTRRHEPTADHDRQGIMSSYALCTRNNTKATTTNVLSPSLTTSTARQIANRRMREWWQMADVGQVRPGGHHIK